VLLGAWAAVAVVVGRVGVIYDGCPCAGWSLAARRPARGLAVDERAGPESWRRCAAARVALLMGGRLLSVDVCDALVAVEEAGGAEPCDGGLRMVAPVSDVMDDFVREWPGGAWPEGARWRDDAEEGGRPEEVVGRTFDVDESGLEVDGGRVTVGARMVRGGLLLVVLDDDDGAS